jgi:protein TonB
MIAATLAPLDARLPLSAAVSIGVHVGALSFFLLYQRANQTVETRTITDVDLMVAPPIPKAAARPAAPKPAPTLKEFLKMALPAIPKPVELKPIPKDVQPEIRREAKVLAEPKLEDRGRLQRAAQLESLDLGRRRESLARIDAGAPLAGRESRPQPALAAPLLEEVGSARATRKAIAQAALEEERRALAPPPPLAAIGGAPLERRSGASAAPLLAPEAQKGPSLGRIARALPDAQAPPPVLQPSAAAPATAVKKPLASLPALPERSQASLQAAPRKAVEIEGPLADRQVVFPNVPKFPPWLKDMGIVEADVSIRFTVDPSGAVLEAMRVEKTSGYGRLDRLAMESLKSWRFSPADPSAGNQWGVITFRFVLE